MTTATDQFTEFATRTQDAVTSAVSTWADTIRSVTSGGAPALPDAHVVVERYFDFAQQVLDNQHAFARTVIDAGTKAAEVATEQAKTVTAQTVNATETVAAKATAATRSAAAAAQNAASRN